MNLFLGQLKCLWLSSILGDEIFPMRFIVDCMLGKLAKWLKILGFDTLYFSKIEDSHLLDLGHEEERVLLTRDNSLMEKAKNIRSLFIESEDWNAQVVQVLDEFDLWKDIRPNSRCIECNVQLKNLSKEKAKNLVVPFVYEYATSFAICPQCGRVFWQGTHHMDMAAKIDDLLKTEP